MHVPQLPTDTYLAPCVVPGRQREQRGSPWTIKHFRAAPGHSAPDLCPLGRPPVPQGRKASVRIELPAVPPSCSVPQLSSRASSCRFREDAGYPSGTRAEGWGRVPQKLGSSGRLEGAAPQRDRLLQVHVGSPRPHDKTLHSSPVTHSVLCSTPQERWSDVPVWREMGLGSSLCTGLWATGTLQARFVTSSCSESPQPQPATLPLIGSCFERPGLAWLCAGYFGSRMASPRIQAGPPCFKNQRLSAMRGQYGEDSPLPWLR